MLEFITDKISRKILVSFFVLFSLSFFIFSQPSDRVNDIHLFPLEELQVDQNTGTIRLYFKLEKAKLVNPEWKLNGTIVKRESPTTGKGGYFLIEPLGDLKTSNFDVQEAPKGEDIFVKITEWESDLKIISAPKNANIFSILLIDVSGSITRSVDGKSKPVLEDLKKAANIFIDSMKIADNRQLAVYAFDGREDLITISDFSDNANNLKLKIKALNSSITKDLSTNLYGAIVRAIEILDKKLEENKNPENILSGTLTIFTDGTDRARRLGTNGFDIVLENMNKIKKERKNVYIYTIGLGREYSEKVLRDFGIDGYRSALSTNAMSAIFRELGESIESLTKCYYKLEYKTPSRKGSGIMQLIVWVKDGVYSGGYRLTFDTENFNF